MKLMPLIPSPKEEQPNLMLVCNQDEFLVESKEIKKSLILEEVSLIPEKIEPSLEEFKAVHDEFTEGLPPDIQHHDTSIRYDFENPFLQEENAQDESFQFFKFKLPTITTWTRRKHDPALSYMDYDENLRGKSRSWDQTLPQAEFVYNTVRGSKDVQEEVQLKIKKTNKKNKATADKKR